MFESTSRYHGLAVKTVTVGSASGEPRPVRYVERRFLPALTAETALAEHVVVQGDRLDLIAGKHLADPTQFWRIADANDGMRPEDLTAQPGRRIVIALPLSR
jgi:nucleoid-associated protein YgaU